MRSERYAIPMHGRYIHNMDGSTSFQPYGKEGQYINSVSRGELNKKLMDLAEHQGAEIFFNHKCDLIDWQTNTLTFELPDSNRRNLKLQITFWCRWSILGC